MDLKNESTYLTDRFTLNFDTFNVETKSLQELQTEVDALIEFRNIVIETFPDLKTKMMSKHSGTLSKRNQIKTKKVRRKSHISNNAEENSLTSPVQVINGALPSYVSRSRSNSNCCRREPKSGEGSSGSTVQDSGFSTETTSSKDGFSTPISSTGLQATKESANRLLSDSDDELLNLLDVIFRKTLRFRSKFPSFPQFENDNNEAYVSEACIPKMLSSKSLYPRCLRFNTNNSVKQNLLRLNKERDKLHLKVAELESEIINNKIKISKMETQLEFLTTGNKNLEEQLKASLKQNQDLKFELFQRKCDTCPKCATPTPTAATKRQTEASIKRQCSKFLTHNINETNGLSNSSSISKYSKEENDRSQQSTICDDITPKFLFHSENVEIMNKIRGIHPSTIKLNPDFVCKSSKNDIQSMEKLGRILHSPKCVFKSREQDTNKIAAILLETNPLELQKHLLTLTIKTQARRYHEQQNSFIPLDINKNSSKPALHELDTFKEPPREPLTPGENSQCDIVSITGESNNDDIIINNDDKIHTDSETNINLSKRLKPSKIPLYGSKALHSSSKSIHKSLSLSTGNIYIKNNKLNQQDSLTLKSRGSSSLAAAGPKILSARSVHLKTNRDLETDRFIQLDSLTQPKKSYKTNDYIQTDKKIGSNSQLTNSLKTSSYRRETKIGEYSERHVDISDRNTRTEIDDRIGYKPQPDVQMFIGGLKTSNYRNLITNSSNNNSLTEDKPFTDDHIGRARNLRSTLLGWLKI